MFALFGTINGQCLEKLQCKCENISGGGRKCKREAHFVFHAANVTRSQRLNVHKLLMV